MSRSARRSDSFNDAFDALFAAAYSAALDVLGDDQEAEDIAVEAMARTYARWARLEKRASLRDWVVLNALALSLDVVKRSGTATAKADVAADLGVDGATDHADGTTHDEEILAIAGLPRREREVIALRELAGLSIEACAAVLGISTRAVAGLNDRGKAHLRRGSTTAEPVGDDPTTADPATADPATAEPVGDDPTTVTPASGEEVGADG